MRLSWGVDKYGFVVVVDDDRNPHKAISGKLNHFQAVVFIDRLKRKYKKSLSRRQCDPIRTSQVARLQKPEASQ